MLDNGDIATELNSSNMLWCLAGNIAVTHKILFGINFEKDGLAFRPFVPKALGDERTLTGFRYRNATLNITVKGYGDRIASFTLNGKDHKPFLPADIKGENNIVITMADNDIAPLKVNHTANVKAPLTPIARLNGSVFEWNPIEYIGHYVVLRDGKRIATTRQTSFDASVPGEYQVIGVSGDGVESFASEPLSNRAVTVLQMPTESTSAVSPEISYPSKGAIEGYTGEGFFEVDRATAPVSLTLDLPAAGRYAIGVRYANGNGPVNTENKCAIRTLSVDGKRLGLLIMPHRGVANWNDWGRSNTVIADLPAGTHTLTIDFRQENNNMNIATNHALIDCVTVEKIQ